MSQQLAAYQKLIAAEPFSGAQVQELRSKFPFFAAQDAAHAAGQAPHAYLDTAATAQRPASVIEAEAQFLTAHNAAVHRGASAATGEATYSFEASRESLAKYVGAGSADTLVWAAGATDAINLLATGIGEASIAASGLHTAASLGVPGSERFALGAGDEIVLTAAEHHANLIPWQRLAARTGAKLVVVPVGADGTWQLSDFTARLNRNTRIVAFTHVSNVTGWIAPVQELAAEVHRLCPDAISVLDACQSAPHIPLEFADLGVDFAAFSGHKMFAPNGIGALLGKTELFQALPPARTGGSAITTVTTERAEFMPPPQRFEPGTPAVSQVIGFGAAVSFLNTIPAARAAATEHALIERLLDGIAALDGVHVVGPQDAAARVGLVTVSVDGIHPHDIGQVLDSLGVTVRVGHHCAQPLHRALDLTASVRASVHFNNTPEEVDRFIAGLTEAQRYFGGK